MERGIDMEKATNQRKNQTIKRIVGIAAIPAICLIVSLIMCASFGTVLFKDGNSMSTYMYGTVYLTLIAFAVSINLHSGRFDFSIGATVTLTSTIVIVLACNGCDNMGLLLLIALVSGALAGLVSGGLYLLLRLPPMICSLGVSLLYEAIAYVIAGGSEQNNVIMKNQAASGIMKAFVGAGGKSPIYLILILVTSLAFMIVVFHYTKFGYDYRALQSGQKIAVNTGANEYLNTLICYVISGLMTGAAGMLFGCQIQYTRVSAYLNFGTVDKMFTAFCPLFFSGLVMRYCNKQVAILISVLGYEFLQLAFGNMSAVNTTFTSTIYGIINSVILVLFLIYLNNENKVIEIVTLKKFLGKKQAA